MSRRARRRAGGTEPGGARGEARPPEAAPATSPPPMALRHLLVMVLAAGLLGGLVETGMVMLAYVAGLTVRLSSDYVWMIPLGDVAFVLLAVLGIRLLALRWPRLACRDVMVGVAVGTACLGPLFLIEPLFRSMVLLLAAGIGVQAGRLWSRPWVRRIGRRAAAAVAVAGVALVLLLGISMRRSLAAEAARARAALPPPPADAPNVLLLILDTVRQQSTSLGGTATTPALAALAERGVSFDHAIAPAPWTLPSHASFFTGLPPHEHGAGWGGPLGPEHPTLARRLAEAGYATAGFVGNLLFTTRVVGLGRGFVHYEDYPLSVGQAFLSTAIGRSLAEFTGLRRLLGHHELLNRRTAEDVADAFLDWHATVGERPFLAFLNFYDAHEPVFPPGRSGSLLWPGPRWTGFEHEAKLARGTDAWIGEKWSLEAEERRIQRTAYEAAITMADLQLARVLAELEARGALDRTVVIVLGDHGEQVGEHGLYDHTNSLYLETLHVPLVLAGPGMPEGVRVPATVSLTDLPATVTDLLGLSRQAPFPGRSWAEYWRAPAGSRADTAFALLERSAEGEDWYPVRRGPAMFSLTTDAHHYIRNGDGTEELYDLRTDPEQRTDLARDAAAVAHLERFRSRLGRVLQGTAAGG